MVINRHPSIIEKKISDKDKKDWKTFTQSSEKIDNKDKEIFKEKKSSKKKINRFTWLHFG